MNSPATNIFQKLLNEEFEKKKEKRQMDIVAVKRKHFNSLVERANDDLWNKLYASATKNYYNVVHLMKIEPYPDELQLSKEAEFSIKCCFCYSALLSSDRFKDEDVNTVLLDIIKELNDKFRKRLFPMFLLVLLNFHRKEWLTTLTWCNEIVKYMDEEEVNDKGTEIFKELLPKTLEIKNEVDICEEVAYFRYGERLTKNAILEPQFEKYKNWMGKLGDFAEGKVTQSQPAVSETELHMVFHKEIFPMWCLANGKDHKTYYSDKFATKCTHCVRAKLHEGIPQKSDLPEDQVKFESFVGQSADFYQNHAYEFVYELLDTRNGKAKVEALPEPEKKKVKGAASKKQCCSAMVQTEKPKSSHRHVQTEGVKTRSVEVQVNNDSSILTAILEIKNKYMTTQDKKDDTIAKLNRRIQELQDKINKDNNTKKTAEQEFEKKTANFKFQIQKLKEQLAERDKKQKAESEKNVTLQKLLVEQMSDKYSLHKQHYKIFEKQASFMVTYLMDLLTFLTPKSIPNENVCRQNIETWENHLRKIKGSLEQLDTFYQNVRSDMIKSDVFGTPWPEMPEIPRLEDNVIFHNFKAAIRNIIQTEEKLYWKYTADCQTQMQRPAPLAPMNFPYNIQRAQFPPQNNMFVGPRLVYSNAAAVSLPMQYQPQMQPAPKKERLPPELTIPIVSANLELKQISEQKLRMSKSMEYLDKADCKNASPTKGNGQQSGKKSAGAGKKATDKKEKEVILLDYVLEHCPGATEEEVTLALLSLLEKNKGTLMSLSKEKIVEDVKIILRMKKQAAWVTPKSPHVDWHNDHTENECAICFDDFSVLEKYTLPCQHDFHKECIKKWLKTSSVCPICRIHSVIDEEFPPLH